MLEHEPQIQEALAALGHAAPEVVEQLVSLAYPAYIPIVPAVFCNAKRSAAEMPFNSVSMPVAFSLNNVARNTHAAR